MTNRSLRRPLIAVLTVAALAVSGAALIGALPGVPAGAASGTVSVAAQYLGGPDHTGFDASETAITASSAPSLTTAWTAPGSTTVTVQPVVSGNTVYWSDWGGVMHATSLVTHQDLSSFTGPNLGSVTCEAEMYGPDSSPAIGQIGSTPVVWVADAHSNVYALNATTGATIWKTSLAIPADNGGTFVWTSPVFNGTHLYMGVASVCDDPLVPSRVVEMDATTGALLSTITMTPPSTNTTTCLGDGVWGTPTIDESTGDVYVDTGNGNCPNDANSEAVIELKADLSGIVSEWQVPPATQPDDADFGSTPTLFSATIAGTSTPMVGVQNKNGTFYAFKRGDLSAPIWSTKISDGGGDPQSGTGNISPAAWDGSQLYLAGGTASQYTNCPGVMEALDPATGAVNWHLCLPGPALGAVIGGGPAGDEVFEVGGGSEAVFVSSSGAQVATWTDPSANPVWGTASIADGLVFIPSLSGNVDVLGLPAVASATTSTITSEPASVSAGSATSTVTVTLNDADGNPVAGKGVTLTAGSGSSVVAPTGGAVTNDAGVASFTVSDPVAEGVTYTGKDVTDNVTVGTASVTFTAASGGGGGGTGGGGAAGGGGATTTSSTTSTTIAPAAVSDFRLAGADRMATAIAVSQHQYAAPGSARAVVLARADDFPDALAGVPLAAASDGPMLLTPAGGPLDPRVEGEMRRVLSPGSTVDILGGESAVAPSVDAALVADGFVVRRIAGANRFATATAVAGALGDPSTVFLARGDDFGDALAAGPAAVLEHGAILFTVGSGLAPETDAYLTANPGQRWCVGGPACAADPGIPAAQSFVGADRYATAAAVATQLFPSAQVAGLASGVTFPDGLTGGAQVAEVGGPLLLTLPDSLPAPTAAYVSGDSALTTLEVFGGPSAVGTTVAP